MGRDAKLSAVEEKRESQGRQKRRIGEPRGRIGRNKRKEEVE